MLCDAPPAGSISRVFAVGFNSRPDNLPLNGPRSVTGRSIDLLRVRRVSDDVINGLQIRSTEASLS